MLRRMLPVMMAGLVAAGVLEEYKVAFDQGITSDADKLDQCAKVIWMFGAFLVYKSVLRVRR